jgi:hypothetical protein
MKKANQHTLHGKQTQDIFDMLLDATIQWNISSAQQKIIATIHYIAINTYLYRDNT